MDPALQFTPEAHTSLERGNIQIPQDGRSESPPASPNPWAVELQEQAEPPRLHTPDPSALDSAVTESFLSTNLESDKPNSLDKAANAQHQSEVLKEFDPLADQEEKAAREAWKTSEGHPPLPIARTPSPPGPVPPAKDEPPQSASSSSFPSLAALARTFSIPSLPRSRPVSLDIAKAVPSPSNLSSLVAQQYNSQKRLDSGSGTASGPSPPRSGAASLMHDSRNDTERDNYKDPPFDFQKFLDQMKTKAAEPVAKYLRS
jgi:hypothetical protein